MKSAEMTEFVRLGTSNYDGVPTEMPTVAPSGNGGVIDAEAWEHFIINLVVFAKDLQDYYHTLQISGWTFTGNTLV